jgi:hypothetical protein
MEKERTDVLHGLRPLQLSDLQRYKDALNQVKRMCWQQYFPYLYFRYEDLLISESEGSICLFYKLNRPDKTTKLYLYFLPMPANTVTLEQCLERVRNFNNNKRAEIYWVDEEDIALLKSLKDNVRAVPLASEYIYDPKTYRSLSGRKKHEIRHDIKRIMARGDVQVREFREKDIKDCIVLMDEWAVIQQDKYDGKVSPRGFAKRCVRHSTLFEKKDLFGQVVLLNGKICAVAFAGEIRKGLANFFIGYADHRINGLGRFQKYHLMLKLDEYDLVNSAYATTPGLQFAKESFCPIAKHGLYRVHVTK